MKDMYKYAREFPIEAIPHISELDEIVDVIHNYKTPDQSQGGVIPDWVRRLAYETVPARFRCDVAEKRQVTVEDSNDGSQNEGFKKKDKKLNLALMAGAP